MRPCPSCARRLEDEAVFCSSCGARLQASTAPLPTAPPRSLWWVHAILALVALTFAPRLDALLQRSPFLVAVAVVLAVSVLVAVLAGRRAGAPAALRPFGRHPAWSTYLATLVLLAAVPKSSPPPQRIAPNATPSANRDVEAAPPPTPAEAARQVERGGSGSR